MTTGAIETLQVARQQCRTCTIATAKSNKLGARIDLPRKDKTEK